MSKLIDRTGQRFGKLVVVGRDASRKNRVYWLCRCDCGTIKSVESYKLRTGNTTSCGCEQYRRNYRDLSGQRFGMLTVKRRVENKQNGKVLYRCQCDCGNTIDVCYGSLVSGDRKCCGCVDLRTKHGQCNTRLYGVWRSMKDRCLNPRCHAYKDYGGRGISICEEWKNDFVAFQKWATESGYNNAAQRGECTLDRINNDGNYEPTNCRWVDMRVQSNNRRARAKKK